MKVLLTGANGFIAQNLGIRLKESPGQDLATLVPDVDAVVHLAGVNRPPSPEEFALANTGLTETLAKALLATGKPIPVILSSSTQAALDSLRL